MMQIVLVLGMENNIYTSVMAPHNTGLFLQQQKTNSVIPLSSKYLTIYLIGCSI